MGSEFARVHKPHFHCPINLWVGIGCQRGISKTLVEEAVRQVFQTYQLAEAAIAGIATIDLKADEVGLVEFCRDRNLPLYCFSAAQLRSVAVPHPSARVASQMGVLSVAEAAAILGGEGRQTGEQTVLPGRAEAGNPSSTPLCLSSAVPASAVLAVPKQILRWEGEPGAVTIAVAQADKK